MISLKARHASQSDLHALAAGTARQLKNIASIRLRPWSFETGNLNRPKSREAHGRAGLTRSCVNPGDKGKHLHVARTQAGPLFASWSIRSDAGFNGDQLARPRVDGIVQPTKRIGPEAVGMAVMEKVEMADRLPSIIGWL